MKRLLCLATVLCLALAVSAPAQITSFSGVAGGTGTVSFEADVITRKGKCKKRNRRGKCVRRGKKRINVTQVLPGMKFSQLPMTCDDGPHTITVTKTQSMPVVNGKFSHTGTSNTGSTVSVTGQFAARAASATGTIRRVGDISTLTGCDTGVLSWSAAK